MRTICICRHYPRSLLRIDDLWECLDCGARFDLAEESKRSVRLVGGVWRWVEEKGRGKDERDL